MNTAKEAKALYDQSGAEVQAYLKYHVDPAIAEAATAGKRMTFIDLGAKPVCERPRATPLDTAVMEELRKVGYVAQFMSDGDAYVPRGLADDDGNGPSYRNYGISIGW